MQSWTVILWGKILKIVDIFPLVPLVWLSSSVSSTHISILGIDKSSVAAFSELYVTKATVQRTKSDDVETEQGPRLSGHLLLSAELRRHQNDSSIRFPYTCLRHRRCFGIDSRRNVTYYYRISAVLSSDILWTDNFCKVCSNAAPLNGVFVKGNWLDTLYFIRFLIVFIL